MSFEKLQGGGELLFLLPIDLRIYEDKLLRLHQLHQHELLNYDCRLQTCDP